MEEESKVVRQFAAIGKSTHDMFGGSKVPEGSVGTIHAVNEGTEEEKARNILQTLQRLTESGHAVEFWTEGTVCWCQIQECVSKHFHQAKGEDFWQALFRATRAMPV